MPSWIVSYAMIVTTMTAIMQKMLMTRPKPTGKRRLGRRSDSTLPTNTKPWFTASASECMAEANIAPLPVKAAAAPLAAASTALPAIATAEDVLPFLINAPSVSGGSSDDGLA